MSRTLDIINDARLVLADPNKTRWSDERLLALLNTAQIEIATKANLIKRTVTLSVLKNKNTYDLPDDIIFLERAYYDGKPLRMVDYKQVDNLGRDRVAARPTHIVFNKHPRNQIVLYPTPADSSTEPLDLPKEIVGVATDLSEIDVKIYDKIGIITDIKAENLEVHVESPFGGISDVLVVMYPLEIYYVAEPAKILDFEQEPEISPVCDKAMKMYIIAAALLDDMDTQSRTNAQVYMTLYNDALADIRKQSALDYVNTLPQVETNSYNGVFEWPAR